MHIREYQNWLTAWDKARTWEQVTLSHTMLHAIEEMGEVSKLVQMFEGYRAPSSDDLEALRAELALELSDLQVMIFKIAYLCGIDMEDAMLRGQQKADARFPDLAASAVDRAHYWERYCAYLQRSGLTTCETQTP